MIYFTLIKESVLKVYKDIYTFAYLCTVTEHMRQGETMKLGPGLSTCDTSQLLPNVSLSDWKFSCIYMLMILHKCHLWIMLDVEIHKN